MIGEFLFIYLFFKSQIPKRLETTAVSSFWSKSDKPTLWTFRKWLIFLHLIAPTQAKQLFIGTHQPSLFTWPLDDGASVKITTLQIG